MFKVIILTAIIAVAYALPGGFIPQAEVSAEAREIAQWAASSLSSTEKHTVVAIRNLATQLVNGINYKFDLELLVDNKVTKICKMDIFEQSWTKTRKFNAEPECSATGVRSVRSVGGYEPTPVNDEVKELANWAAAGMEGLVHTVLSISNYRTQVVSGVNHKFTLELLVDGKVTKTCEMSIFTQAWTNTRKFFEAPQCSASRAGSFQPSEITDKVKEIASWSASTLSTEDKHTIVEIANVQRQIVNGVNYKFTLTLNVEGKPMKVCEMSVYDQAWTGTRHFFETPRCTGAREMVGGFMPQAVVSAEAMEVAQWAAATMSDLANAEFLTLTGKTGNIQHSVMNVKNLRTQVVNGVNYRFTLQMSVSHPPSMVITTKNCEMDVYVNPWSNTRKFNTLPECQ